MRTIEDDDGVIGCLRVLTGERPIRIANRGGGGDWLFCCGDPHPTDAYGDPDPDDFRVVHFGELLERNPEIAAVADLRPDWEAEREPGSAEWNRRFLSMDDLRDGISRDGWFVVHDDGDHGPNFAYTVGLAKAPGAPELAVFGLKPDVSGTVLKTLAKLIRRDGPPIANRRNRDAYREVDTFYIPVDSEKASAYFEAATAFYGSTPAFMQVVWPDNKRRYPWDRRADRRMLAVQPLLGPVPVEATPGRSAWKLPWSK